ncbi:hypothetical protein ACFYW6_36090 [Streptomyces sp. NPDC002659]|uniref:hypothetical protein n=1 Tax=Streptomyces sp. NPDC002659 TaxID=3364656 RepID=UPI0036C2F9DC
MTVVGNLRVRHAQLRLPAGEYVVAEHRYRHTFRADGADDGAACPREADPVAVLPGG